MSPTRAGYRATTNPTFLPSVANYDVLLLGLLPHAPGTGVGSERAEGGSGAIAALGGAGGLEFAVQLLLLDQLAN